MRSRLVPVLIALALGTAVVVAQNNDPRGDIYSARAVQALEQCFDSLGNFTCGGGGAGDFTWTGLNVFNRSAAGVDVCFGGAEGDANSICIDGDTGKIIYEGSTADAFEISLGATDPVDDRTITLPDGSGTVAMIDLVQSWSAEQRFEDDVQIKFGPSLDFFIGWYEVGQLAQLIIDTDGASMQLSASSRFRFDFGNPEAEQINFGPAPIAGGSGEYIKLFPTIPIMDGSDTISAIEVFLTNADHTGTENRLRGLLIDSIGGDADADETAVYLDADGWDQAFFVNGDPARLMRLTGTNPIIDISDTSVFQIQNGLGSGDIELTLNPVSHTIDLFAGDDVTGFDTELQLIAVTAPATTSALPITANVSDLDGGDDLRILSVTVNTPGGSTGTGNLINGVDVDLGGSDPDFVASALRIRGGFDSFLTAEVDVDGWSPTDDPPTNTVALYLDESGANCNLLARLSDGTEITVSVLVVAGNCP